VEIKSLCSSGTAQQGFLNSLEAARARTPSASPAKKDLIMATPAILECDLRDDTIDWHEFANSIRSDADPRTIRRPAEEDEQEDEDDSDE